MGIDCHRAHGHGPQRSESVKHGRWRGGGSSSSSSSSSDSEVRPRIYVYDRPPPEDYSSLIGEDFVHEQGSRGRRRVNESGVGARWVTANDPIYAAGDAFFMRLLRDEEHRTLNPLHADLYFLPLERVLVQNTHDLVASELIDHWIDKWLEAHAQGPLDRHVWVISTDTCAASGSEAALEHLTSWLARHGGIIMCHYGLPHRLMPLMSGERARGSFVLTPGAPKSTLYGSDVDVWTQDRLVKQMHRAWHEVPGLHRKRRPQLLFWGSVRWHQCLGSAACQGCLRNPATRSASCDGLYSRGIRQVMWSRWANNSFANFRTEVSPRAKGAAASQNDEYYAAMLNTEYCLAAPGNGFGVRMIDYVVSGCIPVIVNNSLWFPWEQPLMVRYAEFAHVFALEQVDEVVPVLRAASGVDRVRRRVAMQRHVAKFLWDEVHGAAYETTMEALVQLTVSQRSNIR